LKLLIMRGEPAGSGDETSAGDVPFDAITGGKAFYASAEWCQVCYLPAFDG